MSWIDECYEYYYNMGYAEGYAIGFLTGLTKVYLTQAANGIVIPKEDVLEAVTECTENFMRYQEKYLA